MVLNLDPIKFSELPHVDEVNNEDLVPIVQNGENVVIPVSALPQALVDLKAHYEQAFTLQSSVTVNHNLDRKPAVTFIDSAGDEGEVFVNHVDDNTLTIDFGAPISGVILCN